MKILPRSIKPLLLTTAVCLTGFGVAANAVPVDIDLQAGQRLTIVIPEDKPGADAARQQYFSQVFPLAAAEGFSQTAAFDVSKVLVGDSKATQLALFSWPDADAEQRFERHPDWASLKQTRSAGWDELKINNVDYVAQPPLKLDADKTYTLAQIWLKDKQSYQDYFEATKPLRAELGTKIVFKLHGDVYESLQDGDVAPDLVVLVEWQQAEDPERYTQAPLFKANFDKVEAAFAKFEWYQLQYLPQGYAAQK